MADDQPRQTTSNPQPASDTITGPAATDPAALLRRIERLESLVATLSAAHPTPQPSPTRKPAAQPKPARTDSLETQFGVRVLSKVGVVLLLIGAAWFLKWAFDNRWIGPTGRILAGLAAGIGVVLWSERFRRRGFNAFSYALKAVGSGVLYLSLWAAFQLYHLLPAPAALAAMTAVTAWSAFMAWAQDAELLAGYALLGAYLTPVLLTTGGDHEIFLFTYLFLFAAAVLALLAAKPWPRLMLGVLAATTIYFIAWYSQHFDPSVSTLTLVFALLLWAAMAATPLLARNADGVILGVLTPLAAATFGALTVYSILVDSNQRPLEPWAAVAFAAVYLALTQIKPRSLASAVHLSLGIVFLTIAIPLKATGRAITAGWLAEAVALLWVSILPNQDRRAHNVLRYLACASLLLGTIGALAAPWFNFGAHPAFLNRNFAIALGAIAAITAAIVLASRFTNTTPQPRLTGPTIAAASFLLLNLVLLTAMYRELSLFFHTGIPITAAQSATELSDFAFSAWMLLQGATLLALGFWKRIALPRWLGLLLLAATVIKAFAYDMRNLGTGYRVVSYLGLGIVLMAVSFAYQKDWLSLKTPTSNKSPHEAAR